MRSPWAIPNDPRMYEAWPRPEPRRRDSALMGLLKHEYDCCELTGNVQDLHLHHVVFRSQGGDDVRANVICMTATAHGRYHAGDAVVRRLVAEYIANHRPDTVEYLGSKLGVEAAQLWFEKHGLTNGM